MCQASSHCAHSWLIDSQANVCLTPSAHIVRLPTASWGIPRNQEQYPRISRVQGVEGTQWECDAVVSVLCSCHFLLGN